MQVIADAHSRACKPTQVNNDAFLVDPDLRLFVVADGLRGRHGAAPAARAAIEAVRAEVARRQDTVRSFDNSSAAQFELIRLVEDAVSSACRAVYQLSGSSPEYAGAAATMTLLLVTGGKAVMGHVGVCRLYLYRDGQVHQLSEDHTYVRELVWRGIDAPHGVRLWQVGGADAITGEADGR